jgi:GT2 family glycosyltransferase
MNNKNGRLVSIIVVTKGVKDYLYKCLLSVNKQSYPSKQVIVIDNSLDLNFTQKIKDDFPWVRVCPSAVNLYYSASLNKGIELSIGEFVLCLNDDVVLDREFISEALNGFLLEKCIGMVSGKILRNDKKTLDSTGLYLSIFRTAKERGYGEQDVGQFKNKGYIFGPSGSVAFFRKKMLDDIREGNEYFDSDFVMFYEDIDIMWRANIFHWKGFYIPEAIAYHIRGGSFRPDSGLNKPIARRYLDDKLHADLIKNRYLAIIKNEYIVDFIIHFIPILLYDLCLWIYTVVFYPRVVKIFLSNVRLLYKAKQKKKMRLSRNYLRANFKKTAQSLL